MQHFASINDVTLQDTWLTIGTFDGVHIGHQKILKHLVDGAQVGKQKSVVVTFYPHPAIVLGKRDAANYLTHPDERAKLIGDMGVDYVITQEFDANTGKLSAEEFLDLLKSRLGFVHLVVGHDFALGKNRGGDVDSLGYYASAFGFSLDILEPEWCDDEPVSSSLVREAVANGDMQQAANLLGRYYEIKGEIIHGDGRGKTIGFPTANLQFWHEQALPQNGVYAVEARTSVGTFQGLVNIGTRPTFHLSDSATTIEAHLLSFQGDLYGQVLEIAFLEKLRAEMRFPGVDALISQINVDIERANEVFARSR